MVIYHKAFLKHEDYDRMREIGNKSKGRMQLPLELNIGGTQWSYFTLRAKDPQFQKYAATVYARDNYTCQYCSFRAYTDMSVVNKDSNYNNNSTDNMVTACMLCTQCLFIEMVGKSGVGGGQLIYMPEITQNDLNGICHALFCAMALNANTRQKAESIYNSLKLRSMTIEKDWLPGLSNPSFMGQMIIDTPIKNRDIMQKNFLSSLRLLANYEGFASLIKTWLQSSSPTSVS